MRMQNYLRETAVFSISLYQRLISPYLLPSCRFYPSCSEYAKQAIIKNGLRRGLWQSLGRILRCNPWGMGGYDPVR